MNKVVSGSNIYSEFKENTKEAITSIASEKIQSRIGHEIKSSGEISIKGMNLNQASNYHIEESNAIYNKSTISTEIKMVTTEISKQGGA